MLNLRHNRGAALITALMVMAIVATLSAAMMMTQRLLIQESSLIEQSGHVYVTTQGIEGLARLEILKNWKKNKGKIYNGAYVFKPQIFSGLSWRGQIVDANGLFNINLLKHSQNIPYFARLLTLVDSKVSHEQAMKIAKNVYEWMLPNTSVGVYSSYNPPYQPAHQAFVVTGQLRMVEGVTAPIIRALWSYIIALPAKQKWNINTAPAQVIATFLPKKQATLTNARAIVACRKKGVFKNAKDLGKCLANLSVKNITFPSKLMGFTSQYFLLSGSLTLPNHYHTIGIGALFAMVPAKKSTAATQSVQPGMQKVPPKPPMIKLIGQMW